MKFAKIASGWREKTAITLPAASTNFLENMRKNILPLAITMGIIGGTASLADDALEGIKKVVSNYRYNKNSEDILDRLTVLQPTLALFDRKMIKLYYEQLRHFAPDVAANDLAAASYIKHALAMHDQGIPIATYDILSKTQKQMDDPLSDSRGIFTKSLMIGAKSVPKDLGYSADFEPFFPKN